MKHNIKNRSGFTLSELVVTLAVMGIIASTAVPRFSKVQDQTQSDTNITNMNVIRETFFQYYYRQHMAGNPHFPPSSTDEDRLMDETWANAPMDSTISDLAPNDLFSTGLVPTNANHNPFYYETTYELHSDGTKKHTIILKDTDPDSPSYNQSFSFSI